MRGRCALRAPYGVACRGRDANLTKKAVLLLSGVENLLWRICMGCMVFGTRAQVIFFLRMADVAFWLDY